MTDDPRVIEIREALRCARAGDYTLIGIALGELESLAADVARTSAWPASDVLLERDRALDDRDAAVARAEQAEQALADLYGEVSDAQRIDNTGGDSAVSVALWGWAERRAAIAARVAERDAAVARAEQAERALRYALDCIESPDAPYASGKDIYDAAMMRKAIVRARAALAARSGEREPVRCAKCEGDDSPQLPHTIGCWNDEANIVTCPRCGGGGLVPPGSECPECGGTGSPSCYICGAYVASDEGWRKDGKAWCELHQPVWSRSGEGEQT